jgi:hypothetical protein
VVLPASPGLLRRRRAGHREQLIDFVAGKVLDAAGVPHTLSTRWTGELTLSAARWVVLSPRPGSTARRCAADSRRRPRASPRRLRRPRAALDLRLAEPAVSTRSADAADASGRCPRVTVFGSTRNSAATSPGVSRRSPVSTTPSSRLVSGAAGGHGECRHARSGRTAIRASPQLQVREMRKKPRLRQ